MTVHCIDFGNARVCFAILPLRHRKKVKHSVANALCSFRLKRFFLTTPAMHTEVTKMTALCSKIIAKEVFL